MSTLFSTRHFGAVCLLAIAGTLQAADEPIFSGPQSGEKLPALPCTGVFDAMAGKEIDPVKEAGEKPLLLIFVHEANRPSIAVMRVVTTYAAQRAKDGMQSAVVFLTKDATETEAFLKRARHAMPKEVPCLISKDGLEGPGAYGLNRSMTLTVLVAKEGKVTANFALVQPSVEADAPKILTAMVAAIGSGTVPKLSELGVNDRAMEANAQHPKLREMLVPVINLKATEEQVAQAAAAVEKLAETDAKFKASVGRSAKTINDSGSLEKYGTPAAQVFLKKWAAWGEK